MDIIVFSFDGIYLESLEMVNDSIGTTKGDVNGLWFDSEFYSYKHIIKSKPRFYIDSKKALKHNVRVKWSRSKH